MIRKIQHYFQATSLSQLIGWLAGALFVVFMAQKLAMHYGFHTYFDDLHYYDHSLWEMAQGRGHLINGVNKGWLAHLVHEGNHFSPFFTSVSAVL